MEREAKKRLKFHEALKKIYFPPPPERIPSPRQILPESAVVSVQDPPDFPHQEDSDDDCQEEKDLASCNNTESDGAKKLTRAQRKRIRKKKLKEAAVAEAAAPAQRRKIIGPERPPSICKDEILET